MATYTGLDKRLAYLFANGGGGGGSCKVISGYYHNGDFYEDQSYTQIITGSEDSLYIDLDTTTLYLFDGTDYVEVQGGGGGTVSDGTAGVRIDYRFESGETKAFTYDELGITAQGLYLLAITTSNVGEYGWYYFGYISYGGTGSDGIRITQLLNRNYSLSANQTNNTLSITNTHGTWYIQSRIEVLPLHPKVEIPKHTYSTTEQVVGTWIDGKPIYECTYDLGQDESVSSTAWFSTGITIADIERVVNAQSINSGGTFYPVMVACSNDNISIEACRDNNMIAVRYLTIQYTKTTD